MAGTGTAGADVISQIQTAGSEMIKQIKGLFNLGFPQTVVQGVNPVVTSAGGISTMMLLAIAGIALIFLLKRKK